ncbi:MAG: CoA transferase [Chloroflexi bacterium]|nr:CoA transferase [Chloroflexota bacterium]
MVDADRPLSDLRVIAIEQYGAGPFGSQVLADLGAEVIKVEDPSQGGDVGRSVGPYRTDALPGTGSSLFFQGFNRNKRSITLDLSKPAARAVLHDLARSADAVMDNLRGDVPARLGLTYGALASANPRIVCAHLSGYGRDGPRASWPGYDYLMQAETGYFALTGDPDGPPSRMGLSIVDLMAGITTGLGLLAAVMQARRTGTGRDVDVSLFDTALFNLNYLATWYLSAGAAHGRVARSAHPTLTPCQTYRTADGWIYLMCNKEKFWHHLCRAIERPDWADDPRFRTFPKRLAERDLLTRMLDRALLVRTTAEWMERFGGEVPAAPILDVAQALDNPYLAARGLLLDVPGEAGGPAAYRTVAGPIRLSDSAPPNRPAPALGADTDAVLAGLGYGRDRIEDLRRDGVI